MALLLPFFMGEKPGYKEIAEEFRDHARKASRSLLHGEVAQFYGNIQAQYRQSLMTPEMLDRALDIIRTAVFRQTTVFGFFASTIRTEGDALTNDAFVRGASIELVPLKGSKHDDFGLSLHEAFMDRNFFNVTVRPYPVQFRLGHVFERYAERSKKDPIDIRQEFCDSMPFTLLLAEIIEQKMKREKKNLLPFIAPLPSGLLLGQAEAVDPMTFGNERQLAATREGELKYSRYRWLPEVRLSIFTYISRNEMFPGQRRLHDLLKPYAKYTEDPSLAEMGRTYSDYMDTELRMDPNPRSADFLKIREDITRLIDSKLWKSDVRLPTAMTSDLIGYHRR